MAWARRRCRNCARRFGKMERNSPRIEMPGAANKTKPTQASAASFLAKLTDKRQLADCRELTRLFRELTGKPAKMWGPSIVGFGSYHYVYPTGREGDAPLIGFAPRGNALSLYLCPY